MSKLYAVTAGAYSDYHIVALCSERDKADKIREMYNKNHISWGCASVREYEDGVRVDLERPVYRVVFNKSNAEAKELYGEDKIDALFGYCTEMNRVDNCGNITIVRVSAENVDTAIKIARDLVAEYNARKQGV